jgi:hypothetical protein
MLPGPRRIQAWSSLAQLCDRSGMLPVAEMLLRRVEQNEGGRNYEANKRRRDRGLAG